MQKEYQGEYQRSSNVNGKPSWKHSKNNNRAIWFDSVDNEWKIGDSHDIGEKFSKITTDDGQGSFDLHQISSDKWKIFEIGEGWKKIGPGDVTVQCKGNFEIFFNIFLKMHGIKNYLLILRNLKKL